mgnify:CR=1 FL=1
MHKPKKSTVAGAGPSRSAGGRPRKRPVEPPPTTRCQRPPYLWNKQPPSRLLCSSLPWNGRLRQRPSRRHPSSFIRPSRRHGSPHQLILRLEDHGATKLHYPTIPFLHALSARSSSPVCRLNKGLSCCASVRTSTASAPAGSVARLQQAMRIGTACSASSTSATPMRLVAARAE